jgi:polar amino acid transport system substrate-binding protein
VHDPEEGGGRILGEVCHFADLAAALVGDQPSQVAAEPVAPDGVAALLRFGDGSVASLQYLPGGHPAVAKERIEVFGGGTVVLVDDFRTTTWRGPAGEGRFAERGQDKGHRAGFTEFIRAVRSGEPAPLRFEDSVQSTVTTFRIRDAAAGGVGLPIAAYPPA